MSPIYLLWFAFLPTLQPTPKLLAARDTSHSRASSRPVRQDQTVGSYLNQYIGRLERMNVRVIGPDRAGLIRHLRHFYDALGYRQAWTNRQAIGRLIQVIEDSANDGLLPSDYHIDEIRRYYENPPESPALAARADLLMTDAVFTLMSHMRSGKVYARAIESDWNIEPAVPGSNYDRELMSAVMGSRFPEIISSLRPSSSEYTLLRKGLVRMREFVAVGGWESVPTGKTIDKIGVVDDRIPAIRRRLTVTGEFVPSAAPAARADRHDEPKKGKHRDEQEVEDQDDAEAQDSTASAPDSLMAPMPDTDPELTYDPQLFNAVKLFQKQHGLTADGIIGNETIKAMNVTAAQRVDQIRINLERYRWFLNSRPATYIMVNIPSFTVDLMQNGTRLWHSRVIVGKPDTPTPVFRAEMQYIILNPHWVIPNGVIVKDNIIASILKDRSYLQKKNLAIVDNAGHNVAPSSVDWARYLNGGFPYRLVQDSGDEGSLGRIKFMMPNRFTVYIHDTPSKELFDLSKRTFSHGCVRVEKPVDLAEIVLQNRSKWSKSRIQAAIDTDKTRTITMPRSIPVLIMYHTAFANGDRVEFRNDVYDRDARLLRVLQTPASSRLVEAATH